VISPGGPVRRGRWREPALLLLAWSLALPLGLGAAAAGLGFAGPALDGLTLYGLGLLFLWAYLTRYGPRRHDPALLPIVAALLGLGGVLQARLAPALHARHVAWTAVALLALALGCLLPFRLRRIQQYRYSLALCGVLLVALTLVAGQPGAPGGPRLWLRAGGLSIQPAELLKLVLVLFLAAYLDDKRDLLARASWHLGPLRIMPVPYLAPLVVVIGASLALLAAQSDLGAALLLFGITLCMLYAATRRLSFVALGALAFGAGAYALYGRFPVIQTRLAIWWDPWADAQGFGYQLVQSLLAVSGGGFLGAGLGLGQPTVIPAVHTDFVFSALTEELGMAGALVVILLYALLFLRGMRVALRREGFESLLAMGLSAALAIQSLIIMGGVLQLVPLTGITLPFLSYGGTSLSVSSFMVGLLLRLDRA
jgi:cell division protein FtsW (lipid II flippase)